MSIYIYHPTVVVRIAFCGRSNKTVKLTLARPVLTEAYVCYYNWEEEGVGLNYDKFSFLEGGNV